METKKIKSVDLRLQLISFQIQHLISLVPPEAIDNEALKGLVVSYTGLKSSLSSSIVFITDSSIVFNCSYNLWAHVNTSIGNDVTLCKSKDGSARYYWNQIGLNDSWEWGQCYLYSETESINEHEYLYNDYGSHRDVPLDNLLHIDFSEELTDTVDISLIDIAEKDAITNRAKGLNCIIG